MFIPKLKSTFNVTLLLPIISFYLSLVSAVPVGAKPGFPAIVKSTYTIKPGGTDAAALKSCRFCHVPAGPPILNVYGAAVRDAIKMSGGKTLTAEILHSINSSDSDGDGFSNLAEIKADTLPGDPSSKPAAGVPDVKKPIPVDIEPKEPGLFDPRTLLFPKHAQHRVIIHFPIACFMLSVLFDFLAYWKKNRQLAEAGYYNLIAAGITAPIAVITGLLAWKFAYGGVALQGILLAHLVLGIATSILVAILWRIRMKTTGHESPWPAAPYVILSIITLGVLMLTGHIGGALIG